MARKGKTPKTRLDDAVEKASDKAATGEHWKTQPRPDMSREERRKRLLGLGMTEAEVDAHFAVTGDVVDVHPAAIIASAALAEVLATEAITPEAREWARNKLVTAPTTLCSEHVPNAEKPLECAKCGYPLLDEMLDNGVVRVEGPRRLTADEVKAAYTTPKETDVQVVTSPEQLKEMLDNPGTPFVVHGPRDKTDEWEERVDAARASEDRFEPESLLNSEERLAPLCAVLTPEEFRAILDGPNVETYPLSTVTETDAQHERLREEIKNGIIGAIQDSFIARAEAQSGPEPPGFAGMVEMSKLWIERADVLSKKRGMGLVPYIEWLIKRDWVASGGRGS